MKISTPLKFSAVDNLLIVLDSYAPFGVSTMWLSLNGCFPTQTPLSKILLPLYLTNLLNITLSPKIANFPLYECPVANSKLVFSIFVEWLFHCRHLSLELFSRLNLTTSSVTVFRLALPFVGAGTTCIAFVVADVITKHVPN